MHQRTALTLAASVTAATSAFAQSVWLPENGQLVVTPGYSCQTFDKFRAGKTKSKLPADIVQQTAFLALEYGLTPKFAADATLGYSFVEFDPPGGDRKSVV